MTKRIFIVLCLTVAVCTAQKKPPTQINLKLFPAEEIEDVIIPVPSEIFGILDKLGEPNWRSELSDAKPRTPARRAQIALLLGTVVADGFIAVQAQDAERVKDIGQRVLKLADAINVRKAVLARSKSITEKADKKDWAGVRKEFDGALKDVRGAMEELGDRDLSQLVSLGGWLRGTQVLTSVVGKNYTHDGAELLNQPELVDYFIRKLDALQNPRLKNDALVGKVRKTLRDLKPLLVFGPNEVPSRETVARVNKITKETVQSITGK